MKGGSFAFRVERDKSKVLVTAYDALGVVLTEEASILLDRPDLVTFLGAPDSKGDTWMFGLFPDSRRVIMTRIRPALFGDPTDALGSVMQSACQFTIGSW